MEIVIKEYKNFDLINIIGRIDSYTTPNIKEKIQELIDKGHHNYIVDLSDASYLSSSGILMFVNLQRNLITANKGKIILTEVPGLILSSFKLAGFDDLFEFYDDTKAALRRF